MSSFRFRAIRRSNRRQEVMLSKRAGRCTRRMAVWFPEGRFGPVRPSSFTSLQDREAKSETAWW